jgi:hypothetical protein
MQAHGFEDTNAIAVEMICLCGQTLYPHSSGLYVGSLGTNAIQRLILIQFYAGGTNAVPKMELPVPSLREVDDKSTPGEKG